MKKKRKRLYLLKKLNFDFLGTSEKKEKRRRGKVRRIGVRMDEEGKREGRKEVKKEGRKEGSEEERNEGRNDG